MPTSNLELMLEHELRSILEIAMQRTQTDYFISRMIYTSLGDKLDLKQVPIMRKLLEFIKKKYKDDLMENLL